MASFSLLLLFSLLLYTIGASEPFILNRVAITKNPAKQLSVRFHGHSPDLVLFHAILRFSSPINHHHNSLLIDQSSLNKYSKILVERTNKLTVSSRTVKRALSYLVAHDNTTSDANQDGIADKLQEMIRSASMFGFGGGIGASTSYDGVLLMDEYSSIWNEYNIATFSNSLLTFSHSINGSLTPPESVPEFSGQTRLSCEPSYNSDNCLVTSSPGGLEVNRHLYPSYRVLIDLDSPVNMLPIDLYLRWIASEEQSLTVRVSDDETLFLNRLFQYDIHQSNVILIGVDLLHQFPRVEYSVTKKTFQLNYYETIQNHYDEQRTVKILLVPLMLLLLICLFRFGTGYNYQILPYIIQYSAYARKTHYFAFRQIIFEVLAMVIGWIVIIVSFVYSEPVSTWTAYQQRKVLFTSSIITNSVFTLYFLVAYPAPRRALYRHYCETKQQRLLKKRCVSVEESFLPYGEVFADIEDRTMAENLHKSVVSLYHDPIVKTYTPVTIARNATFITMILTGLQLIFNFYTEDKTIYLAVIVGLTLAQHYYQVKYMAISVVYLSLFYPSRITNTQRKANNTFIVCLILNALSRVSGIYSAYFPIFVAYFDTINSTYSSATIHSYIMSVVATLILLAVIMVTFVYDKYADPIIEAAIQEGTERIAY